MGTLEGPDSDWYLGDGHVVGYRRCPNPACHTHIFVVVRDGELVASYPAEVIDFDSSDLPAPVLSALEESIRCHAAECYRASALMVRRTLEEVCLDQGATGSNLKERIESLTSKVALPVGFIPALHDLRLLGNDAAHVELKDFDDIGLDEATLAIEIAKQLLQPLYQYGALMTKLAALKKQTP